MFPVKIPATVNQTVLIILFLDYPKSFDNIAKANVTLRTILIYSQLSQNEYSSISMQKC